MFTTFLFLLVIESFFEEFPIVAMLIIGFVIISIILRRNKK